MGDAEILFIRPCEPLRSYVRYYYILNSVRGFNVLTFPIGCTQLIFHKGTPLFIPELNSSQSMFTISGQVNFSAHVSSCGYAEMIVVVFQPHAIGWFIDTPPSSFFNLEISGFDIGNGALSGLALRIFDCVDNFRCVHMIENWLLAKLYNVNLPDYYRIGATVARLMECPSAKVTELADVACLCKKQFERVFGRCVGMRPKEYARVVRFQKSMWLMQNGQCNDADIAYASGFADQSHFIREFKAFSGRTPGQLRNEARPYSDLFTDPLTQSMK
ncbi:AraC family transcriptional regulator [Heminiphilus faecis]|uniref:AraC family transcriptional regulator n=1 Tax=Heminiphilus faecis TaxID=2601703 RepID=A0ABV4CZ72_9BACT